MDDWQSRAVFALIPISIAGFGWALSLESRVQVIDTRLQERFTRLDFIDKQLAIMNAEVMDPKPKPETRVQLATIAADVERLKDDISRMNERINNLHAYFIQITPRPPFNPQKDGKRGDMLDLYPQRQP